MLQTHIWLQTLTVACCVIEPQTTLIQAALCKPLTTARCLLISDGPVSTNFSWQFGSWQFGSSAEEAWYAMEGGGVLVT